MDSILKFILYARKHPEKKLHNRFTASHALNANADFDWWHESQKSDIVQKLCTIEGTRKQVICTWKYYKEKICYYDEFYALARRLLKEGRQKDYDPNALAHLLI